MPPAREKVGAFSDERRSLVITVEKGRRDPEWARRNGRPWDAPIAVTIELAGHAHEHDDADSRLARSQSTRHHPRLNLTPYWALFAP